MPNILIAGTPGVGKTLLAKQVADESGLRVLSVAEIAKTSNAYCGFDSVRNCQVLDEDLVLDAMESDLAERNNVVEYHGCDLFEPEQIDLVIVLRCDTSVLYDRLAARGYDQKKVEENVQCEIFQTILEEARETFEESRIFELQSNTPEDLLSNTERLVTWIRENG